MSNIERHYQAYLAAPLSDNERKEIVDNKETLINAGNFDGLPSFGTGGMRSVVAAGSNRLNRFNILRLNLALANVLNKHFDKPKVVIGYDSRLSSTEFALIAYSILKAKGIDTKVFKRPTPTPLVSFAVRKYQAQGGIVITASHNPSEYNGFKVYGEDGGQIVPPFDQEIEAEFKTMSYAGLPIDLLQNEIAPADLIEEEVVADFLERLAKEDFTSTEKKSIRVLYSPLHGTGGYFFEKTFNHLGFENFALLENQSNPDGNFPNTTGLNPEEARAFAGLQTEGQKTDAQLLLATDPDADRVGCAVKKGSQYSLLTGNQIGALLLAQIASQKATSLKAPFACKTIVTSEIQTRIAAKYGVKMVETLTGFKYIAAAIAKDPENYLFGGEESYGYLPVSWIRDKDSISSAIALAELAEKTNLFEFLNEIYLEHGIYHELLHNINLGDRPPGFMQELLGRFDNPSNVLGIGDSLGPRSVIDILDVRDSGQPPRTPAAQAVKNELPGAQVIQYWFEPEGRLTIRPSGTEPKIKIYLSLRSKELPTQDNLSAEKDNLGNEAQSILQAFLDKLSL